MEIIGVSVSWVWVRILIGSLYLDIGRVCRCYNNEMEFVILYKFLNYYISFFNSKGIFIVRFIYIEF